MDKRPKAKLNIPMCAACVLLCLTMISIHLMSGLYAKYTTSAQGGDFARVIKFGDLTLTETGSFYQENKLMIIPGVDLQKKVEVDFKGSESATYIFIDITPTNWVTTDYKNFSMVVNGKTVMSWSIADGWTFLKPEGGKYIYYRELEPNSKLDSVDVIAEDGKITVSDQITNDDIKLMTGISLKLRATVVQAGGFESVEDAWNSIAAKDAA